MKVLMSIDKSKLTPEQVEAIMKMVGSCAE